MGTFLFQCLLVVCVLWSCEALVFTIQPMSMTIPEGTSIILSCEVDQAENVVFSWTLNNVPVEDSSRIFMDTSNSLKIGDVSREDAGQYRCVVEPSSTAEAPMSSDPANVNVTLLGRKSIVETKIGTRVRQENPRLEAPGIRLLPSAFHNIKLITRPQALPQVHKHPYIAEDETQRSL